MTVHQMLLLFVDRKAQTLVSVVVVDFEGELFVEQARAVPVRHSAGAALQWLSVGYQRHLHENIRQRRMDASHSDD